MKNSFIRTVSLCAVGLLALQGCAGVIGGLGATAGVAAVQEGGLSRAGKDAIIQAQINELWFSHDVEMFTKLDITINSGRVLLTGVVQNPEHRVEAVRLAWQPKNVEQVINEINVADSDGLTGFARDTWISGRLRTALMFDRDVQSVNYSIDTVKRVVYLMGWAQDQAERNRVMEVARTMSDVEQVISYVKLVGEKDIPVERNTISSQQYAKPPSDVHADPNGERIDWVNAPGEPQQIQPQAGGESVIILPEPAGYPNVEGRAPVLTEPVPGVPEAVQSEDLLWNVNQ